jgi:hypothetical protein
LVAEQDVSDTIPVSTISSFVCLSEELIPTCNMRHLMRM